MFDTAMIFAAGLGTRLAPLTNNKPKALVELAGKSMLLRTVEKLATAGVKKIVVNIHHFPEKMREAIDGFGYEGGEFVISDESEQLLDTGGGLLKAAAHLSGNKPFLVHNVDIISDVDFSDLYLFHTREAALATLAVSRRDTNRYFLFDNNRLCGWQNVATGEQIKARETAELPVQMAFSGVHAISPAIFDLITETGKFSINQVYLRLAAHHKIMGMEHNSVHWADMGSIEKMERAERMLRENPGKYS